MIAGLADINRPAEKLSLMQSSALAGTGVIWSRYSLVITPKNWNLFSVNVFVAATGIYQLSRIYRYGCHDDSSHIGGLLVSRPPKEGGVC